MRKCRRIEFVHDFDVFKAKRSSLSYIPILEKRSQISDLPSALDAKILRRKISAGVGEGEGVVLTLTRKPFMQINFPVQNFIMLFSRVV